MSTMKPMTKALEWTGERYLPWTEEPATSYEHWHRYAFASQFTPGKRVLDLASGEGYGTALLSRTARFAVGVDIDRDAVRHARNRYGGGNLDFVAGSAALTPFRESSFDMITCFELIEHIQEQDTLLREAKRLLAPEGLLLISTPNKPEYNQTEISNPFHTKELELNEFQALLSKYFKESRLLGQRVYSCSSLWPAQAGSSNHASAFFLECEAGEFSLSNSRPRVPLYFVAIASDAESLPEIVESVLLDTSNSLLKQHDRIQKELETTVVSQKEALSWREKQVNQLQLTISSQETALAWRESQVRERNQAFETLQLESARAIDELQRAIESARNDLQFQKKVADELSEQMRILQSSRSWRLIQSFLRIRERALPPGTGRRNAYDRVLARIKL
jgi:ubiquinone/menaquinone biosynthesis C-methylase UbiE